MSLIDDMLLRDTSPRETWATITNERLMRREIARELSNHANHVYKIDQEAVIADENETTFACVQPHLHSKRQSN